ncbi:MAG TPA: N-acetylglucosamine-6-phosphate deacetylase [Candidatus Saccharimonadales bacterium]|nr:N-acetylglucosamine-6-phosphate deacetylase [Candidatus Saccharimonadales bacterium]
MRLGVEAALVHGELVPGDVTIEDGRVVDVGLPGGPHGLIAIPGLVDIQINGYGGVDFLSALTEDYRSAGEALLLTGVTAYQPTFITAAEATTVEALRALPAGGVGPRVLGAHLEGPFLSAERPGMHPVEHMRAPDVELLDRLLDAGPVTEMTLAPELPGADALIRRLRERGVVVSAGHTNATAEEASRGFDLGIAGLTHVFNAMRPLRSRDPGVAGAALTRPDVVVKMIVDGHHLARETVQLVWACAAGRVALITDAMAAAGAGGGTFHFGEAEVELEAGAAPMLEDGTLAGSVLTMIDAVRNLHALGVPFERAVGAATEVPARLLGRDDIGVLEPGGPADIVVLDDRLEIQTVLCAGTDNVVVTD